MITVRCDTREVVLRRDGQHVVTDLNVGHEEVLVARVKARR
jgi:hypothetical protein